jgi:hypothetical protein
VVNYIRGLFTKISKNLLASREIYRTLKLRTNFSGFPESNVLESPKRPARAE